MPGSAAVGIGVSRPHTEGGHSDIPFPSIRLCWLQMWHAYNKPNSYKGSQASVSWLGTSRVSVGLALGLAMLGSRTVGVGGVGQMRGPEAWKHWLWWHGNATRHFVSGGQPPTLVRKCPPANAHSETAGGSRRRHVGIVGRSQGTASTPHKGLQLTSTPRAPVAARWRQVDRKLQRRASHRAAMPAPWPDGHDHSPYHGEPLER